MVEFAVIPLSFSINNGKLTILLFIISGTVTSLSNEISVVQELIFRPGLSHGSRGFGKRSAFGV